MDTRPANHASLPPIALYSILSAILGFGTVAGLLWSQPGRAVWVSAVVACYLVIVAGGVLVARRGAFARNAG